MASVKAINELIGIIQKNINIQNKKARKGKKQKSKQQRKGKQIIPLQFIEIDKHKISLSHCPTNQLIKYWQTEQGITDIITLLRIDEPRCIGIRDKCKSLNIIWHHLPISGAKKLCSSIPQSGFDEAKESEDLKSLNKTKDIIDILNKSKHQRRIVIHCAAGQHRTGLTAYLILRQMGNNMDDSLNAIKGIRPVTYTEMTKQRKPSTWFQDDKIKTLTDFAEAYIKFTS